MNEQVAASIRGVLNDFYTNIERNSIFSTKDYRIIKSSPGYIVVCGPGIEGIELEHEELKDAQTLALRLQSAYSAGEFDHMIKENNGNKGE